MSRVEPLPPLVRNGQRLVASRRRIARSYRAILAPPRCFTVAVRPHGVAANRNFQNGRCGPNCGRTAYAFGCLARPRKMVGLRDISQGQRRVRQHEDGMVPECAGSRDDARASTPAVGPCGETPAGASVVPSVVRRAWRSTTLLCPSRLATSFATGTSRRPFPSIRSFTVQSGFLRRRDVRGRRRINHARGSER